MRVARHHLPPLLRLRPEPPYGGYPLRRCTFNTTTDENSSDIRTCGTCLLRLALRPTVKPVTTVPTLHTRLALRPDSTLSQRQRSIHTLPCSEAASLVDFVSMYTLLCPSAEQNPADTPAPDAVSPCGTTAPPASALSATLPRLPLRYGGSAADLSSRSPHSESCDTAATYRHVCQRYVSPCGQAAPVLDKRGPPGKPVGTDKLDGSWPGAQKAPGTTRVVRSTLDRAERIRNGLAPRRTSPPRRLHFSPNEFEGTCPTAVQPCGRPGCE